jgi:hypothetical protein
MKLRGLVAAALQVVVRSAFAQEAPRLDMPENMREAFSIVLNRDNFATAVSKLGNSQRLQADGESVERWCYKSGNVSSLVVLVLSSHVAIGGPDRFVDEIRVVRADSSRIDLSKCPTTRNTMWTEGTPGGLRLEMSYAELAKVLPRPAVKFPGKFVMYSWWTDNPLPTSLPSYAFWNSKLAECFRKGRDKTYARGQIVVRLANDHVYEFILTRGPMTCCCGIGGA